ncbi:mandelate racemase/muconate lactonizing enzyme family protein [Acuticoccus kandeliae]|uniref:mandelate racemase/muconate lactonizing enzyme family protein n=1 Tax=Acuticoccus kandeliae TaxID=2073160 RepID=UPI0014756277|nr:enolase C-terminal domain-like protein [Acuticoccus kandeliae]
MRIRDFSIERLTLADHDPDWRIAGRAIPFNEACIVTLRAEGGIAGEGYAAAYAHLGTTQEETFAALRVMGEALIGWEVDAVDAAMARLRGLVARNNPAKAAIDCALHDLKARALGVPLHALYGGKVRDRLPLMRILALKDPAAMAEEARALVDAGYRGLKVKVAGDVAADAARVAAVRAAVGDGVRLAVDANMAFGVAEAIRFAALVEGAGLAFFEQPVAADDIAGLAAVARAVAVPVEADEAAGSADAVRAIAARGGVASVNLKLARSGGIGPTFEMAGICAAAGVAVRMGANVGSQLLVAHAVHVAAALPALGGLSELAEFARLDGDPYRGLAIEDGAVLVPDGPGTGVARR